MPHLNNYIYLVFYVPAQILPLRYNVELIIFGGTTFIMFGIIKMAFRKHLIKNVHVMNLNDLPEKYFFMCTIASLVNHSKINPPRFRFLQFYILANILVLGLNLTHLSSLFLFNNPFLQYFQFAK